MGLTINLTNLSKTEKDSLSQAIHETIHGFKPGDNVFFRKNNTSYRGTYLSSAGSLATLTHSGVLATRKGLKQITCVIPMTHVKPIRKEMRP